MKSRLKTSLNALRTFEAVARLGSMTHAARELGVTPGAVSRQISELQSGLNFDLFEGVHKNQRVTHTSGQLAATLTRSFDEIDAALRALDPSSDRLLDVACLSTSAIRWLIPRLHRFRDQFPDIDLRLSTDPRAPNKMTHRVDVSIMVLSPDEAVSSQETILFPEALGPVLRADIAAAQDVKTPDDLYQLLQLTARTRPLAAADWLGATKAGPPAQARVVEFDHLSLALEAVINGMGWCITPQHLVAKDILSGVLVAPFGFEPSGYKYVVRAHGRRKPKVDGFVKWLVQDISETAD